MDEVSGDQQCHQSVQPTVVGDPRMKNDDHKANIEPSNKNRCGWRIMDEGNIKSHDDKGVLHLIPRQRDCRNMTRMMRMTVTNTKTLTKKCIVAKITKPCLLRNDIQKLHDRDKKRSIPRIVMIRRLLPSRLI